MKFAERIARDLGEAGFVHRVRSRARHRRRARIAAASRRGTVAVLAGGHNRIYPAEHEGLLDEHLSRPAPRFRKCRSAGSRARAIFPAATG